MNPLIAASRPNCQLHGLPGHVYNDLLMQISNTKYMKSPHFLSPVRAESAPGITDLVYIGQSYGLLILRERGPMCATILGKSDVSIHTLLDVLFNYQLYDFSSR